MGELIKRQDAINAVMQNYCYECFGHTCRKNLQARACVERLFDRGYLRKHSVCL